jgi:N-acyl-D-amino-acid deacylase
MAADQFDIILRRGRIIDGTGNPWYIGDVGIVGDRIDAIGNLSDAGAKRSIDATGRVVCPGFIDLHTHGDLAHLADPDAAPRVMQGVTTDVIGQDGLSYAPVDAESLEYFIGAVKAINGRPEGIDYDWRTVDDFLAKFDQKTSLNVAYLLPHGPVRYLGMGGSYDRPPTASEMDKMRSIIAEAMQSGAVGLSTGLTYAPCSFAPRDELTELCREVAKYDGVFMPHLRSYGVGVEEAMQEAVQIAREAGCALHFTHHQVVFPINEHRVDAYTLAIDDARAEGMDVTCGSYPYIAGSTFIRGFFPGWSQKLSASEFAEALADPVQRAQLRHEVEVAGCDGSHGVPIDWSGVQISSVKTSEGERWIGMRVDAAARKENREPFDFIADLLTQEEGEVACVAFFGYEHAIQQIMQHHAHLVESDAILTGAKPHPRAWGCHARYLARYVRELGILTWEQAIRKMTSGPAARIGITDRGMLRVGSAADVVVFDPETIQDTATFDDPKQHPTGIETVIVNGVPVVDEGSHTHARPGRALRRG